MKKIRVNLIVFLVVSAMIALLIIQTFQTLQLYDRKARQFDMNLHTALERIAVHHEKAEDIRKYLKIVNKDFSGQYKDIIKNEFKHLLSADESISIKDTAIFEDGKLKNYLLIKGKTTDKITGLSAEQKILAKDVRKLQDLMNDPNGKRISNDSLQIALKLDQRVLNQIFKKAKFVNEMMIQAFKNNDYAKLQDRLDIFFLDSVIKHELKDDDLPQKFKFTITDSLNQVVKLKNHPADYVTELHPNLGGSTVLFPSNILDDDYYLHLQFPKKKSFILKEMWMSFVITLLLVFLIIVTLAFLFKTILTQKKLSEAKTNFVSNMTHEFKTPISTISLACQALSDKELSGVIPENGQLFIKMINDENRRLSDLVEKILQSASIERKELKMKMVEINLNELLMELIDNAKFRLQSTNGTLTFDLPSEDLWIKGDAFHLRHAISNLIDNAIKYCKDVPHIHIHLEKEGSRPVLSVKDEGIGMKKEELSKIFDKLYRISTGNVHNVKGFGLGLSYVQEIIKLHGWNISVKSKPGEGSEFKIEF